MRDKLELNIDSQILHAYAYVNYHTISRTSDLRNSLRAAHDSPMLRMWCQLWEQINESSSAESVVFKFRSVSSCFKINVLSSCLHAENRVF